MWACADVCFECRGSVLFRTTIGTDVERYLESRIVCAIPGHFCVRITLGLQSPRDRQRQRQQGDRETGRQTDRQTDRERFIEEGDPDKVSGNPDVLRRHFCPKFLGAIHRLNYFLRQGFGRDLMIQKRPYRPHL